MKILLVFTLLAGVLFGQGQPSSTLQLQTPPPSGVQTVSAFTVGNQGNSNYCYWVVAVYPGGMANPLTSSCVARSAATLNSSNYNTISWTLTTGATGYWVIRSTSNNFPATGTVAVNTTVLSSTTATLNDQSNTLHAFTYSPMAVANATFTLFNTGPFVFPNVVGDTAYNITFFADLPAASIKKGILYVVYDSPSPTTCSGGGGVGTPSLCLSNGVTWIPMATSVSGGTTTIQTNGVSNTSQNPVNFTNSATFNGLTFTQTNPAGGIVQLGATGTLDNSGLTGGSLYVRTNQANTYGAGLKQTFVSNGTTAGVNLGSASGDPSSRADGDLWYDNTKFTLNTNWTGIIGRYPYVLSSLTPVGGNCLTWVSNSSWSIGQTPCGAGSGTVTSFSSGSLAPYFTASVASPTTTPSLTFTANTFSADNILGNFTSGTAVPSTQIIPTCANDGIHALVYASHTLVCAALTTGGAGTVTSVGFTGGLISVGTPTTTPAFTVAGTSGGIPYFSSSSTWASSGVLGANLPLFGGGAGSSPIAGTRSGNTTTVVTTTGAQTSGNCVQIDASGNHIASGAPCGSSSGGSVFDGSAVQSNSFSATPTVSLANVSVRSPTRIEMGTLTGNVTSVTFTNVPSQGGAKFSMVWSQGGGGNTVTYGGTVVGNCVVDPTAGVTTTQLFEVTASGAAISGTGCTTDNTGVEGGPEAGTAPGASGTGKFWRYVDPTTHAPTWKTQAGIFNALIANTCSGSDFVNSINSSGVVTCSTPAGSGNVSNSGTPLIHQIGVWTAATTIKGIAVGTTDKPLVGATGADPAFSNLTITNPASSSTTLTVASGGSLITTGANSLTLATTGTTVASIPSGTVVIPQTLVTGATALGTSAIGGNSCATTVTSAATGVTTGDVILFTPSADISSVTGYGAASTDGLVIYPFPTSGNVNFKVCNTTGTSITPGAVTINFKVLR